MSDKPASNNPEKKSEPVGDAKAAKGKSAKKRRTWRQRIKLAVLVILILAVVVRIALNLLLPTVIRRVAGAFDLDCEYSRMDLNLMDGNAHIWNFVLRPKSGGESIVVADYVQGVISPWNLLKLKLVVYRAEVDGVNILVDREKDGSIPLLKKILPQANQPAAPIAIKSPPAGANGPVKPLSLQAPLRVDAVRVTHVNTKFRDLSVTPTFETTIKTNLRISDVGSMQSPAKFELEVEMDPLLDTFYVQGVAQNTPDSVKANVQVLVRGLHLKSAAGYLTPLGIKPVADDLTVRANLVLTANVIPNSQDVSAQLSLNKITATADNAEWAGLEQLTLDVPRVSTTGAKLGKLTIENGRLSAQRTAAGAIRIAGIELAAAPATTQPAAELTVVAANAPAKPTPVPATTSGGAPAYSVSLHEIDLKNLQATFDDAGIRPAAKVVGRVNDLSIKGISLDPAAANTPIAINGDFSLPGIMQAIRATGSVTPFATMKHLALAVQGSGMKPDAIKPYLDRLGIQSEIENATVAANVDASAAIDSAGVISASAGITGIRLHDGDAPLLSFDTAKLSGITVNPKANAIGVGTIELAGPTLGIYRDTDGRVGAAGFRLVPPVAAPAVVASTPVVPASTTATNPPVASTSAPASFNLPRIEIGQLKWSNIHVGLRDETVSPPAEVMLGDAGVEVDHLLVDLNSNVANQQPGTFKAWLSAPKVVDHLTVEGTLVPNPHSLVVETHVTGDGITGEAIAPYLRGLGIEPVMKAGTINLKSKVSVSQTNGGFAAALDFADVKYSDGSNELAGVDRLHLAGLGFESKQISVDQLVIDRPRGQLMRNHDGSFQAGGIRLVPIVAAATTQPGNESSAPMPVTPSASAENSGLPAIHLPALPMKIVLKDFQMHDGSAQWIDNAVTPNVKTQVSGTVALVNAVVGSSAGPATLHVAAKVDGSMDSATVDGQLTLDPQAPAARLKITADGLRVAQLAAYLPSNLVCTLKDGHFATTLDLGAANNPAGGIAAHLGVNGLTFGDGANKTSLAKVDAFKLDASRIDPTGGAIALKEISSAGVATEVRKAPDGAIEAMGIRIKPVASQPAAAAHAAVRAAGEARLAAEQIAPAQVASDSSASAASPTTQPNTAMLDTAAMVANARRPLPLVTIDKLDLGLERFTAIGMTGDNAAPIALANVHVKNLSPIEMGGHDSESRPPVKLHIDGGIDPVVSQFAVGIESSPLASEPSVKVDLSASGIKGDGLTSVVPSLKPTLDGSKLTDGAFHTHLDASINYGRRGPRDLDVMRGFTAVFDVKPVEFRETQDGPVIAGLDEIRSDGIKVSPMTAEGGIGDVQIKTIEITKPIGRFSRDAQGIHGFGFLLPLAPSSSVEETKPATQVAAAAPVVKEETPPPPAAAPPQAVLPVRPKNEIRLDELTVSGIDVIVEDTTSTPPTIIPLKTLDVEVDDVSNQTPWNGKPIRFSMLCTSDKVPLPPRKGIQGVANTQPTTGEYTEMRELFSQVTASGRVGITQHNNQMALDGWAKTSVDGFELLGVRGLAKQMGITIGGGVFDDSNDMRFNPDGLIETKNKLVFTNLSLSEPANGPLQSLFKLPAPIDVAIGAITDPDGSITMNLPVPIKSGTVSGSDVVGPAIGAVGSVLITGIASAPVKAIGGVGSLIGLGGGKAKPLPPVEIHFLPGYAELDSNDAALLNLLAMQMQKDKNLELQLKHELTAGDVARASVRANPSPAECAVLAEQLRQRKAELLQRRATISAQATGEIGSQSSAQAASSLAALRDIDRQIARAEDSLDQLYDMLRPGAQSQGERRTRAASIDIGKQRLDAIQDQLEQDDGRAVRDRIHLTNPQFDPSEASDGGTVVITLVPKKH